MSAHSVNRATIAGLGTTAALLAAVIAVSLVVGGLVAYTGSPSGPFVTREPRLALPAGTADATPRAARTRAPLVVPAATPEPDAPVAGGGVGDAGGPAGAAPATASPATPVAAVPGPVTARDPVAGTPAVATPSTPALPVVPAVPAPVPAVADTTAATGEALGGTLRDTIGAVGDAIGTLAPQLRRTVDGVSPVVGGTVTGGTDGLAATLRRLGG